MLLAKAWLPGLMVIRFNFWLARLSPVNIVSQQCSLECHRVRDIFYWPKPKTGPQGHKHEGTANHSNIHSYKEEKKQHSK